jgi:tryptophanyl-tRNA synthetase
MRRISADPAYVDAVLRKGGERARELAETTMKGVRDIIGFSTTERMSGRLPSAMA